MVRKKGNPQQERLPLKTAFFGEGHATEQSQESTLPEERQPCREEIMRSLEQIKLSVSDFPSFITFSLRGYLQARCDNFRAGCVSHSSDAWSRLTSDKEILSTVSGMAIEFDSPRCQH